MHVNTNPTRTNRLSERVDAFFSTCMWFAVTRTCALLSFVLLPSGILQAGIPEIEPGPDLGRYVIHISVDGLRPDAITRHEPDELPNFYRLRNEGAFTDHAHTDVDYSNTLPNHIAQLTSRPVVGQHGHNWTSNTDPLPGVTLHTHKGAYVASVFDVAHDNGLRTGAYASKSKFVLFDRSYNEENGAPDLTGPDNGRDKIDTFVIEEDTEDLVERFIRDMKADPFNYAFVHLRDPDSKGHFWGWRLWEWHPYMSAVRHVDELLGQILEMVETDPRLAGNTTIILTADHGGSGHGHSSSDPEHFTIPFYVWGPGIDALDLYALNEGRFWEPVNGRPGFAAPHQPIRNGSAGNLALSLLNLGPIPGSSINTYTTLAVHSPEFPPAEFTTEADVAEESDED